MASCNLRFDDTNPDTEDTSYVEGIIADLRWLGYEPGEPLYASDYFEQIYDWAELLITDGKAYVDDQDSETIRTQRGGYGKPGVESPYRNRTTEENLDLFRRMRAGEFEDGARVLRAKVDMQHENMQLRDPVMYRIRRGHHHRTHDAWVIYPTYDWAHGQSDAIEGVTHSLCTLEFDSHRPLYDWYLEQLPLPFDQPRQTEFARLELTYTVTSKRKLAPARRRRHGRRVGRPPHAHAARAAPPRLPRQRRSASSARSSVSPAPTAAIRSSCSSRSCAPSSTAPRSAAWPCCGRCGWCSPTGRPMPRAPRGRPLRGRQQPGERGRRRRARWRSAASCSSSATTSWPNRRRSSSGCRPASEVRLRGAYLVTCTGFDTDADGEVTAVYATHDPASKGGNAPDGRKVKSTMHWVSAAHAVPATVALYERLFSSEVPGEATGDPFDDLNRESRETLPGCMVEAALGDTPLGEVVQFERLGYFAHDPRERDAVPPHRRPQGRVGQHPEASGLTSSAAAHRIRVDATQER